MVLERLRSRQILVEQLGKTADKMKEEIRRAHNSTQTLLNSCTPEEMEIVRTYKDLETVAELDDEIQSVSARLEMMSGGSEQAVRVFENREQQIRKTRESLEKHVAALEEAQDKIKEIKGPFEKDLDALIAKISDAFAHNFAQIGCAGEVSVYKDDDDFNAWSIQISVRFRYVHGNSCVVGTTDAPIARASPCLSLTLTVNPVASALCRQSSTSWLSKTLHKHHSGLSTRSTRVWIRATSAWYTSGWSTSLVKSVRVNTSSSRRSCSRA